MTHVNVNNVMTHVNVHCPINPTIGVYQHVRSLSRRDAVIIHRLRIGHTWLTHSYLLLGTTAVMLCIAAYSVSTDFSAYHCHEFSLSASLLDCYAAAA